VLLIGFRGAGKTTIGRRVARRLKRPFLDVDREIERRTGQSVRAFFRRRGEAEFRRFEERVLRDLARRPPHVVATGGGIVERGACRRILSRLGPCVWLDVAEAELMRRLGRSSGRPILTGGSVVDEAPELLRRRRPWYRALAVIRIRCGSASAERIAARIDRRIRIVERRWTAARSIP
jgi:shikimate kinase